MFPKLLSLLKVKCMACHRFQSGGRYCLVIAAKIDLIDGGRLGEALGLDREIAALSRGGSMVGVGGENPDGDEEAI